MHWASRPAFRWCAWSSIEKVLVILIGLLIMLHIGMLWRAPAELYIDEVSISRNAATIAAFGSDEYGQPWPLYFSAFGEYKNPLYIYTTAGLYAVFSKSNFVLRLTSMLYFLLAIVAVVWLAQTLFRQRKLAAMVALFFVAMGAYWVLDWVAFEAISLVALIAWWLLAIARTQVTHGKKQIGWSIMAGVAVGALPYTYSTGRILVVACGLLSWLVLARQGWKVWLGYSASALLTVLPAAVYMAQHGQNLLARYRTISVFQANEPMASSLWQAFSNYWAHWSPWYLWLSGDANIRHNLLLGGISSVGVLLIGGLLGYKFVQHGLRSSWRSLKTIVQNDRFLQLVLLLAIVSPLPAALTNEGIPHLIRSLPQALCIALLASYGLYYAHISAGQFRLIAGITTLEAILLAGILYTTYPTMATAAFDESKHAAQAQYCMQATAHNLITATPSDMLYWYHFAPTTLPVGAKQARVGNCTITQASNG
jgi:4-amino-4-deoxy-L-arabinose transferase-like glycosyltransferase